MNIEDFVQIRHYLGKSQSQLARLLCVSPKTVQSFEQGWREIPSSAERQLLFLLSLKNELPETTRQCWETRNCPDEWKAKCAAWEFQAGRLCWFVNGTFCNGKPQDSWKKKVELCRQCEVFQPLKTICWLD